MKISAVVNTYNAPRQLDFVLRGMARQVELPHEVLIADDGSKEETRTLVESWQRKFPVPLIHVWQVDSGFRRCRILNEAVRRGSGDYFIFLDGDSVPHRLWISDHRTAASRSRVLCGRRVRLGEKISAALTPAEIESGALEKPFGPLLSSGLRRDSSRVLLGVRLPALVARLFHPKSRKLMGVNFSMHRETLEKVNGFNEDFTFYGFEDYDLEIRLRRAGYKLYPLLNRAVVYHLYHPMNSFTEEGRRRLKEMQSSDAIRCAKGLDQPGPFDPQGQ